MGTEDGRRHGTTGRAQCYRCKRCGTPAIERIEYGCAGVREACRGLVGDMGGPPVDVRRDQAEDLRL